MNARKPWVRTPRTRRHAPGPGAYISNSSGWCLLLWYIPIYGTECRNGGALEARPAPGGGGRTHRPRGAAAVRAPWVRAGDDGRGRRGGVREPAPAVPAVPVEAGPGLERDEGRAGRGEAPGRRAPRGRRAAGRGGRGADHPDPAPVRRSRGGEPGAAAPPPDGERPGAPQSPRAPGDRA